MTLVLVDKNHTKAFSVIELLVAIAIIAIISLVAIPSLKSIVGKNHAITYTNKLMTTLQFARSVAIKLGESVIFCGSKDQKTCDGSWQNGAIVVTTKANEIIRAMPPVFAGDKLIWRGSSGIKNAITFSPAGFPNGQQGSFYYCPQNSAENALTIILNSTGRVRAANKTRREKQFLVISEA